MDNISTSDVVNMHVCCVIGYYEDSALIKDFSKADNDGERGGDGVNECYKHGYRERRVVFYTRAVKSN